MKLLSKLALASLLFLALPFAAHAQTQFELTCPSGTSVDVTGGQTFDSLSGKYRQVVCIDPLGNYLLNSPVGLFSGSLVGPICNVFSSGCNGNSYTPVSGNARCITQVSPMANNECMGGVTPTTDGVTNIVTCAGCFIPSDDGKLSWAWTRTSTPGSTVDMYEGRTVKFLDTGHILVSGAVPTGSASGNNVLVIGNDDSAALNAVAAAASPRGTVYLPCGNYMVSANAIFQITSTWKYFALVGEDRNCVQIWWPFNFTLTASGPLGSFAPAGGSGKVSDVTWNGLDNGPNCGAKELIVPVVALFHNVTFKNWNGSTGTNCEAIHNVGGQALIDNLVVSNAPNGIVLQGSNVTVLNPTISAMSAATDWGIYDTRTSQSYNTIIGGLVQASTTGTAVRVGDGGAANGLKIIGTNLVSGSGGFGLVLDFAGSDATCIGCVFGPPPGQVAGGMGSISLVAGATVYVEDSSLYSDGSGFVLNNAGTVNWGPTNQYRTTNAGGFSTGAGVLRSTGISEIVTGSCVASAATATFVRSYPVAPTVTISDNTSASTGAQVTATSATTATIHCNGATDSWTATVVGTPST